MIFSIFENSNKRSSIRIYQTPCSRGYLGRKSLDFQKQKTEEKQMKNIPKYGIVLFSVAVLAATNSVVTVAANDVATPSSETIVSETHNVHNVQITHWDTSGRRPKLLEQQNVQISEGDTYTVAPNQYDGYKFTKAITPNEDGLGVDVELPHQLKYGGLKQIDLLYKKAEPEKPAPNPEQPEKPTPAQTQKFNINYWALRGGEGGTSLGTETVEVSPGETYTVQKKDFPGYEFQGASIDNGATGTDVELPYNLKYGDSNQGIDLFYKKKSQKPAEPEKPAPTPTPTPDPKPTPEPTPQPTPNPSDNGNNSNQGNKLNPSDNKPSDNGNGKSENPTDNQNPAKNGNDSTPSDNGEKQNNSNQGDNNRDTTKQSEINKSDETTKNKLPNTGEAVSSLGFLGVGLLSSLGLTKKRYKGRHERH